ncbi:phosphate regulon transcriptional regulator PhoB [Psychromonas sp. MME2]|uniref:phosphate regulon transcriptional regulator PhoB n=1 Tax=unclassified Psychromonas TaxID=2614957 RepID=UPI00339BCF6F
MATRILVVEDEIDIREMLCYVIDQHGYQCTEADSYSSAVKQLIEPYPDLILLDWMFPGGSGIKLLQYLKQDEILRKIPVIMLTARGAEEDKVRCLENGADDYVTKPFSPKELMARLKSVLRRVNPTSLDDTLEVGKLKLDPLSHRVSIAETAIEIGPTEFRLLHFFMAHAERVFSREQLLNNVWGTNVYIEDRTVDVHIRRLRKALLDHDYLVQTVRGAGYRFSVRT